MTIPVPGVIHRLHGMVAVKHLIVQMTAEEIWSELKRLGGSGFSFVTISGGNPALLRNLDATYCYFKGKRHKNRSGDTGKQMAGMAV